MENVYGFVPSVITGEEQKLTADDFSSLPMPKAYSYKPYMSSILNQGTASTCVPHSISAVYDYYAAMEDNIYTPDGKFVHTPFSINQIYNARTNRGEGMSYKEALNFCMNHGVVSEENYKKGITEPGKKIYSYAIIPSLEIMKRSLIINGPCLIATYVKDPDRNDFWNGRGNYGGHATCIIGYDDNKKALLLRNSWGKEWGNNGYTWFPYSQYDQIIEAWAVLI